MLFSSIPALANDKERPLNPFFHHLSNPYLANLAAVGVRPEEVDFVFNTHLHVDHVGWNTMLRDGRWKPTFPNARYVFPRTVLFKPG
jgi:glyoxylase-like metal-dependent hydrolase (beta-lactamase superfamily II)